MKMYKTMTPMLMKLKNSPITKHKITIYKIIAIIIMIINNNQLI